MNGDQKKLVEQLEAAMANLRALEEALARTHRMIDQTRKIIDQAKEPQEPDADPPAIDETP